MRPQLQGLEFDTLVNQCFIRNLQLCSPTIVILTEANKQGATRAMRPPDPE